jgi:hypothetical protein
MELYQGMCLAKNDLSEAGVSLEIMPFDTKRDEKTTRNILKKVPKDYFDLIVGPLYSGPVQAVKAYSTEKSVNMINPLSSNSQVMSNSSYCYLFKPSLETRAIELAEYADSYFKNRNVLIFYERGDQDSVFAATYHMEMLKRGFNVIRHQELTAENAKGILDELIKQKEVFYTKIEADSINLLRGRFVKPKHLKPNEVSRVLKNPNLQTDKTSQFYLPLSYDEDEKPITYYENVLVLGKDSIGHILGATSKNFLANNLISAVETMGDSTKLFGYGNWLDFTMLSYAQLERLGVELVYPDFINKNGLKYKEVCDKVLAEYKIPATTYHLQGYELMYQMGKLMNDNGAYFQNGKTGKKLRRGIIYEGLRFGEGKDNQVVPIVKFENGELKVVNSASYEN